MAKKFPLHPANAMACANERSPHPAELFGENWLAWGNQQLASIDTPQTPAVPSETNPGK